jgi:hypothetical protein
VEVTTALCSSLVSQLHLTDHSTQLLNNWCKVKVKVKVMLRPTVNRPVCLCVKHHLGLTTSFSLLSGTCGLVDVGRSLRRDSESAVYNCCWYSPAQSFLGWSPAGLVTIFYYLRFETPPTWRSRSPYFYPPKTGWPSYTPRHFVRFSSHSTTRRYSKLPPRGVSVNLVM